MISKETYEIMKKKYGKVASWGIWDYETSGPKSNVGNLKIFDYPEIYKALNPDYVFVGLNVSGTEVWDVPIWRNFHSTSPRHNDYKLRYALRDTKFWGSYLTDIIKLHADTNGENVMQYIKKNPDVLRENINSFKEEIGYLGGKPTLIAMGGKVNTILTENLGNEYNIVPIKHYSYTISKEAYRKELLEAI